jgi:hypothetical protein
MVKWYEAEEFNVDTTTPSQEVVEEEKPTTPWYEDEQFTPVNRFEGITFDTATQNNELMESINRYYRTRDPDDFDPQTREEAFDYFINDRVRKDQNLTFGAGPELLYMWDDETTDEQKQELATLREAWDTLPNIFQEGGRPFFSGLFDNLGEAMLDPLTYVGAGIGGQVAKQVGKKAATEIIKEATKEGLSQSVKQAIKSGTTKKLLAGVTTTAAIDASIGAGIEAAHEGVEIDIGTREEYDPTQIALVGILSGLGSLAPGAVGVGLSMRKVKPKAATTEPLPSDIQKTVDDYKNNNFNKDPTLWDKTTALVKERIKPDYWVQKALDANLSVRTGELGKVFGGYYENGVYQAFRRFENTRQMVRMSLDEGTFRFANQDELINNPDSTTMDFGDLEFDGGKPFVDILKSVMDEPDGIENFLFGIAAHRERHSRDVRNIKITNATDEQIDTMIKVWDENPAFQKAHADYVASGMIGPEGRARIDDAGEFGMWYIPAFRSEITQAGKTKLKGKGIGETGLKRMHGIGKEGLNVNDPLENIIKNIESHITASYLNITKRALYDRLEELSKVDPDFVARFATKKDPRLHKNLLNPEALKGKLKSMGLSDDALKEVEDVLSTDALEFWTRMGKPSGDGIDVVMRNGKAEFWDIHDPMLLDTMEALGRTPEMGNIMQAMSKLKRGFTWSVTHEPTFVLRNLTRDSIGSAVLSRVNSPHNVPLVNIAQSINYEIRNNKDYQEFILNGGGFTSIRQAEKGFDKLKASSWYRQRGINPDKVLWNDNLVAEFTSKAYKGYNNFLSNMENAARVAEYRGAIAKGMSKKEAAFLARDVSTDFSMRGSSLGVQRWAAITPFLNPGAQGMYHTVRRLKQDKLLTGMKGFLGITLPTLVMYQYNKEYDVYNQQLDYVKNSHWVIPADENGLPWPGNENAVDVYLLPKPYDVGAFFASVFERLFEAVEKGDTILEGADLALYHWYKIASEQMMLNPVPLLGTALWNQAKNEKFGGSPIVNAALEGREPMFQTKPSTSLIAQWAGKASNTSPLRIQQFVEDITGSMGSLVIDGSDRLARWAMVGEPDLPALKAEQYPVLRAIYKSQTAMSQDEIEFYRLVRNLRTPANTLNAMKREGNVGNIEYLINNLPGYAEAAKASPMVASKAKELGDINKAIRRIEGSNQRVLFLVLWKLLEKCQS